MQLSEMQAVSRSKADEENSDFISDPILIGHLNQGCTLIHGKIAQKFTDQLAVRGTIANGGIFSTVVGQEKYLLPTTVKKLIIVHTRFNGSTSDNDWRKVDRLNPGNDTGETYYPVREGYNPGFGYEYEGDSIYFKPTPQQVFQVRLKFVPQFVLLVNPNDVPKFPVEFHQLATEYAAIQMLRKSGEGIYKESMAIFNIELQNMLDTCEYPNQQGEQMVITDDIAYGW